MHSIDRHHYHHHHHHHHHHHRNRDVSRGHRAISRPFLACGQSDTLRIVRLGDDGDGGGDDDGDGDGDGDDGDNA